MGYAKIYFKKMDKKRSKVKKVMRIKIGHVLAKIFHKREICFKEHSRIKLVTKYPHTYTS